MFLKKVAKMLCFENESNACLLPGRIEKDVRALVLEVYVVALFLEFLCFCFPCHALLSDDPLLLRLEGRHAVGLELLSGPALGG